MRWSEVGDRYSQHQPQMSIISSASRGGRSIEAHKPRENLYPSPPIFASFSNISYPRSIMSHLSNTVCAQTLAMAQAWQAFPAQHQALLRQGYCVVAHTLEQTQTPTTRDFEQFIVNDPNAGYRVCCFHNCHRRFHHTRRQRAVMHIRRHFGYRQYACDGTCGVSAWYVSRGPFLRRANWSSH